MKFSTTILAAIAALSPIVSAHMRVSYPPTTFEEDSDHSRDPLDTETGYNYPCFDRTGWIGKGYGATKPAEEFVLQAGSQSRFDIEGTAVHGGGSCQISVTYDIGLSKDADFRVIESYEGGCPTTAPGNLLENDPNNKFPLLYTLPNDLHNGKAILAWTWFNNVGNREMYMRCTPVTITGGATSDAAFKKLPPMFKANINKDPATCHTLENKLGAKSLRFPTVNKDSNTTTTVLGDNFLVDPVGNCAPDVTPAPSKPVPTSTPVEEAPATTVKPGNEHYAKPTITKSPKPEPSVEAPKPEPPVKAPEQVETTPPPPPAAGGCTSGTIICLSEKTWALCNHGKAQTMGAVANGLLCKEGKMVVAKHSRRNVRFSGAHRRRHHATMLKL